MTFQRALITGATSGIGEALAYLLAEKHISLILTGRNQQRLETLASSLNQKVNVTVLSADLANSVERQKVIHIIRTECPDLIINNAGFGIYGASVDISLEEQMKMIEVNSVALVECAIEGARALKERDKKGVIMNVSSVAGDLPTPGMAIYGASKAFVTSFSRALNTELSSYNIHVLVACPGQVATDFAHRAAKKRVTQREGGVMSVSFAARQIWKQIERKKEYYVFNTRYRFFLFLAKTIAPLSFVKQLIWRSIQKRI